MKSIDEQLAEYRNDSRICRKCGELAQDHSKNVFDGHTVELFCHSRLEDGTKFDNLLDGLKLSKQRKSKIITFGKFEPRTDLD